MRIPNILVTGIAAGVIAVSASAVFAADAPPERIRGTIESVQGSTLVVKARSGQSDTITLAPDVQVATVKDVALGDIKQGDFVGTAAVPGANGHLKALELHLFPEAMRGSGEGFRPFDLQPNSSMTNATIGQITEMSANGRTLTLNYKDGDKTGQQIVDIPAGVPVVEFLPGDASLLQPGKAVILFAVKQGDGYASKRLVVESNGVKPPM